MRKGKKTKKSFGLFVVTGAIVFFLNALGFDLHAFDSGTVSNDALKIHTEESKDDIQDNELHKEEITTDSMQVHFLDVDQGLAILVKIGDDVLVYDGGERDTSSFVVAYLKEQGITEIDYLISSHYDSDHVSGLIGCLYAFDVKNVIGSNYVHDSNLYTSFMTAVEEEGLEVLYPAVGTQYEIGDAFFTILSPEEIVKDSNSNSVAIKLTYGESDFIFTGDADYKSERAMIASGIDLDCEVLSVGHHGSASATSEKFLEATTPEYAVISCGENNSYGHPHKEVLGFLQDYQVEILRNDESGTIVAETDGTELVWSMEKP